MITDLKLAFRQLLKNPGFTVVAILILALGIGANTAMFSLINALLFKPLVVERPNELVRLHSRNIDPGAGYRNFSYPNFVDIRSRNDVFDNLAAFAFSLAGVTEGDDTRRVTAMAVTANYFQTFGVRPDRGRDFLPQEERPGAGIPVVIVSHAFWKRSGADPDLVNRALTINGHHFEVVGVAPEGFAGTSALISPDLYVPLGVQEWLVNDFMDRNRRSLEDRNNHCLMVAGRLRSGLSMVQAQGQLDSLAAQLEAAFPKENQDQSLVLARPSRLNIGVAPSQDDEIGGLAALLLPMAGVVLVIAGLNLANMLLARGTVRQKEFAIRTALGGGRLQIIRQLVSEGLILSLAGGLFALLLSSWVGQLLSGTLAKQIPSMTISLDSRLDVRVLLVTFVFCLLATLVASLMPALRLSRVDVIRDLRDHGTEGRSGSNHWRLVSARNLLIVLQLSLSFVLLVAAGLFFRSASQAAAANPGFRFEQGVVIELDPSLAGYDEARSRRVVRVALDRARQLPGVDSASLASSVPFGLFSDGRRIGRTGTRQAEGEGGEIPEEARPLNANYVVVTDDYFRSLGTPVLRGRDFNRLEVEGATEERVAILNEAAAERLWPGEEALGRQFEILDEGSGSTPVVLRVVGIAPGFKAAIGDADSSPFLYLPLGQAFQSMLHLHVRLKRPDIAAETAMLKTLRAALKEVDPQLPLLSMHTLRDFHSEGLAMWLFRTASLLFFIFGLLALVLAAVGVYGVKAFLVERRTREIGIRMALGASPGMVLWLVLRGSLKLLIVGLALGGLLALAVGHLLRGMLFGVSASDPLSYGLALLVLTGAAVGASLLPARRAARIHPMEALRTE